MSPWAAVLIAGGALVFGAAAGWLLTRAAARRSVATVRTELARRLDELFALHELTYVLGESLDPSRVAQLIADYLERFFSARGAVVVLADERGAVSIAAAAGTLADLVGQPIRDGDPGLIATSMGREHIELAEPGAAESDALLLDGRRVERAAIVPLRAHGITLGAVGMADAPQPFPTAELRLLSTVATHAAAVLSNARLFALVQRARDEWESTFDALTSGLAVVDDQNRIRRANRALAELVDQDARGLVARPVADAVFGDTPEIPALLATARKHGVSATRTVRSSRVDRLLRVTAAALHGSGTGAWVVLMLEDVTEQQLLEAQLIQNEKIAAVGQLVSGVAHELNNPLTSIAGLAEFLLERLDLDARDREHLRIVREQADRAGRIVRNLLTFARRGPAEVTDLDLNDIVSRTAALVGYEVRLRDATLETDLAPDLPAVRGDRHQIQQVVVNLVTNALQAVQDNPADRPRRIRIGTTAAGDEVLLRVEDTGSGIPEDAAAEIFTPFFTTKAPGEGTGLGLAIAYRIMQGHHGELTVEPAAEGGAAFVMRLPAAGGGIGMSAATPAEPATPELPAAGARILLVDADPAVRRMITVLLGTVRHEVVAADDAAEAVERLERDRYDLVIADPRTAVSAGERFGDYLLRRWPALRTRTIFLTADVRPETQTWLRDLGVRYFVKPFRVGELKAAAAELLQAAGTRPAG